MYMWTSKGVFTVPIAKREKLNKHSMDIDSSFWVFFLHEFSFLEIQIYLKHFQR